MDLLNIFTIGGSNLALTFQRKRTFLNKKGGTRC